MRAVVTRVSTASVSINGETVGKIDKGFLVLLGIKDTDTKEDAEKLSTKICTLRVVSDAAGKMNLDLETV
jgi:D-tyrosyl-tRNA(Tyr) deacylase